MAKILIVDDSAMSRRMMRRILENANHNVIEAEDGMIAVEKYFLEKPDIVMLDRDIFAIDPTEIEKTRAVLTIMDGRIVFAAR